MRGLVGLALASLGVGYAALAHYGASDDRESQLAAVTKIVAETASPESGATVPEDYVGLRKPIPSYAPAELTTLSRAAPEAAAASNPADVPADQIAATTQAASPAATGAAVWTARVANQPDAAADVVSGAPPVAASQLDLATSIQRELKRVGCYGGRLNGRWSPGTKRAMSAFLSRVNASLPMREPDVVLLTLLQGHNADVCGTDCPRGQTLAGGRCTPMAIVADAANPSKPATAAAAVRKNVTATVLNTPARNVPVVEDRSEVAALDLETLASPPRAMEPLPGRMSIGGPGVDEPRPSVAAVATPQVTTEQLPWLDQAANDDAIVVPAPVPATRPSAAAKGTIATAAAQKAAAQRMAAIEADTASEHLSSAEADQPVNALDGVEPKPVQGSAIPVGKKSVAALSPPPRKPARLQRNRPAFAAALRPPPRKAYRRYATRSVQTLFTHPLGRL